VDGGPAPVTQPPTFTDLRKLLGFGVVRLKVLWALTQEPCLDEQDWSGEFVVMISRNEGRTGSRGRFVKWAVRRALREVEVEVSSGD
jgi:hypothetical protein